jgi:hypothetical protein
MQQDEIVITVTPHTAVDVTLTIYKMLCKRQALNKRAIWLRNKTISLNPKCTTITIKKTD